MDTKRRCVRESLRSAQVTTEPKGAEDPKPTTPCSANTKRGMRKTHTSTHANTPWDTVLGTPKRDEERRGGVGKSEGR